MNRKVRNRLADLLLGAFDDPAKRDAIPRLALYLDLCAGQRLPRISVCDLEATWARRYPELAAHPWSSAEDKAPQTLKNTLALLRRIVNFGVKRHYCQPLPFHLELPKVHNIKTEDLTPEQLSRLLEALEQDTNIQAAAFMKMPLFTGMRRGELFRLKWTDIDFERHFIHLRTPKGGADQKIPLNPAAREVLANHPRLSDYVFPGRGGNKRVDITKQVNRIKEAAGLPKDFRALHGLRHVYASMLASSGQVEILLK